MGQHECLWGVREQEVFRSWVDQSKIAQLEEQLQQMGKKRLQTSIFINQKSNM